MAGLPREILKWLQSLDLTYSVKNPKRDFASGYLVGEILSRYYPNDLHMHAFDNGSQLQRKTINWDHLKRIFKKLELPITEQDWEPVMHVAPDAAIALVVKLYNLLTKKEVKKPQRPVPGQLPTYARPTAMQAIRDHEVQRIQDKKTRDTMVKTILKTHNEQLKLEKTEPGRLLAPSKRIRSTAQPSLVQTEPPQEEQVEIKQIEVKTMDKNFRTAKAFQMKSGDPAVKDSLGKEFQVIKPSLEIISEGVLEVLHQSVFKNVRISEFRDAEVSEELARQFVAKIDGLPNEFVRAVFESIETRASTIADSMVKSAQEFENWAKLVRDFLSTVSSASVAVPHFVSLVAACGKHMLQAQPNLTEQLFNDFMIASLAPSLTQTDGKLEVVCAVISHFSSGFPGIRLSYLWSILEATGTYASLLAVISHLVKEDTEFISDLHIYYQYYSALGLQHCSPLVRSNAMTILASLASFNPQGVIEQLPKVLNLKDDRWWEVRAQTLRLAGVLLEAVKDEAITATLQELVLNIFTPGASQNVVRVGLIALASCLRSQTWLREPYLHCLFSLPAQCRREVLASDIGEPRRCVQGPSSQCYILSGAPSLWDSLAMASTLANDIEDRRLDHLEVAHVDLLWACLQAPLVEQAWVQVYTQLRDYLLMGLCDPRISASCIAILQHFFNSDEILAPIIAISKESLVNTFVMLVNSTVAAECLDGVYALIRGLYWDFKKPALQEFTYDVLKTFADAHLEVFERSSFVEIMNEIITHRRGELFSEDKDSQSLKSSLSNMNK